MSHKTLINGTAYNVIGGTTLVNGTSYSISKGNTLVGGTAYTIPFGGDSDIPNGFTLYPSWSDTNYSYNNEYMQALPDGRVIARRYGTSLWDVLEVGMDSFTILDTVNPDNYTYDTFCAVSGDYVAITKNRSTTSSVCSVYFYKYLDGELTLLGNTSFSNHGAFVTGKINGNGNFVVFGGDSNSTLKYQVVNIADDLVVGGGNLTKSRNKYMSRLIYYDDKLYWNNNVSNNNYYLSYYQVNGTTLNNQVNTTVLGNTYDYYTQSISNNLFNNNLLITTRSANNTTTPFGVYNSNGNLIYTQAQNGTSTSYGSSTAYNCYQDGENRNILLFYDYSNHTSISVFADDGTLIDSIVANDSQMLPSQTSCFTKIAPYTYYMNNGVNNFVFTYK